MNLIKAEYYTDPICPYCYAFDEILNKLLAEHGSEMIITYHMGGLMQSLDTFFVNKKGLTSVEDLAKNGEQLGEKLGIKISGDGWRNDPTTSSYPASVAYYAAKTFGDDKGAAYLQLIRKKLYEQNKNIAREAVLTETAEEVGIPKKDFLAAFRSPKATAEFEADLALGQKNNARMFPTVIFYKDNGEELRVVGFRPYEEYTEALQNAKN